MINDNGGSRTGVERRQLDYSEFIPERRSGGERRKGVDRRMGLGQRRGHQSQGGRLPIERRDQFRINIDLQKEGLDSGGSEALD
jgi:hypothetical protein